MNFVPALEMVKAHRGEATRYPVYREIPADMDTPVSVFLKLCRRPDQQLIQGAQATQPCFLLESAEAGKRFGRYSFIGLNPTRSLVAYGECMTLAGQDGSVKELCGDPFDILREQVTAETVVDVPDLPRFKGGAVGMFGYDMVRFIEKLPATAEDLIGTPDMVMLFSDELVIFDHVKHRLMVMVNLDLTHPDLDRAYTDTCRRINAICDRIHAPFAEPDLPEICDDSPWACSKTPEEYAEIVRRTRDYIIAGDIFQGVLSMRQTRATQADPFTIYRALRMVNPSSYMFYLDFSHIPGLKGPPMRLVGSSPEMHVRLEDRQASLHPIAGSRWRGETPEEDRQLAEDLLADPKERAEHVMLVDLGRNDLGRVCDYGSVQVANVMQIERYSHIMHIVSDVQGQLREGMDGIDLIRATLPAGTVSGAPKIRAMEIIEELEASRRGPYAGVVGYIDHDGTMDTCITIRTITMLGATCVLQAGGGLVMDSQPEYEYNEAMNKMRALTTAVALAENALQF
ncbi:MAG: anthranilate synthase component I [Caldilineaceae bacterium]|nr:anthranilate synthase component I [Caldilineaceae bacterium]